MRQLALRRVGFAFALSANSRPVTAAFSSHRS
jgi:hypothetical protein